MQTGKYPLALASDGDIPRDTTLQKEEEAK